MSKLYFIWGGKKDFHQYPLCSFFLFFKYCRYTLSLPPFVWKDLTDDPSAQKIVHCKDKTNVGKPFYISVSTFLNILISLSMILLFKFLLIFYNIIGRLLVRLRGYILKKLTGKLCQALYINWILLLLQFFEIFFYILFIILYKYDFISSFKNLFNMCKTKDPLEWHA